MMSGTMLAGPPPVRFGCRLRRYRAASLRVLCGLSADLVFTRAVSWNPSPGEVPR
jgi:hypothetical protein